MTFYSTILVIHTKSWSRQVQFARLVIDTFGTVEEAKEFIKTFPNGDRVEVWDNDQKVEEYFK